MLFLNNYGKLTNIEKNNYKNDFLYYEEIIRIKNINNQSFNNFKNNESFNNFKNNESFNNIINNKSFNNIINKVNKVNIV